MLYNTLRWETARVSRSAFGFPMATHQGWLIGEAAEKEDD